MKRQSTEKFRITRTTSSSKKCTFDDDFDEDTDDDIQIENQPDIDCEDEDEDVLESIYQNDVYINFDIIEYILFFLLVFQQSDTSFTSSSSSSYSNNDETQADLMNMSIATEHSYCCQTTLRSSNSLNNATKKNLTSSPLQSPYVSNSFDNSLSPIDRSKNVNVTPTRHKIIKIRVCNEE
jgi:hypothetical protein